MSCKTVTFELFGVQYQTTQFNAVRAVEIMAMKGAASPLDSLANTEALKPGTKDFAKVVKAGYSPIPDMWIRLDNRRAINSLVHDTCGAACPTVVLKALLARVKDVNFGFMDGWKGVQIPTRFSSGVDSKDSAHIDPLLSALLQNDQASLKELEEYYSLEDAFKMYDVIVAKSVNVALANEAAQREAKARRSR